MVLSRQEYEYLKGYNIYIKTKEWELRELIEKLNEKNSNSNNKDKKIASLEQTIREIWKEQVKLDQEKETAVNKSKHWKKKHDELLKDNSDYKEQVLSLMRQNKLLMHAISH